MDPTQATVDIRTNVACGDDAPAPDTLYETGLVAGSEATVAKSALQGTTRACKDPGGDIGSIVIYPRDGARRASLLVVGAIGDASAEQCLALARGGAGDASSCIVARRSVAFVPNVDLHLPVLLDLRCAGYLCEESQTCAFQDGRPRCVSAEVSCEDGECEPTGAGGASGAGGAGGAGGGGGSGGAPLVSFETLPPPAGLSGSRAVGVSEDGAIVVGNAGSLVPVAWRDGQALALDAAQGFVSDACGNGDVLAGTTLTPTTTARTWVWIDASASYQSVWSSEVTGSSGVDCAANGHVLASEPGQSFKVYSPPAPMALVAVSADPSEIAADESLVVGANAGTPGASFCFLSPNGTGVSCSTLGVSGDRAVAVSANGSVAAVVVGSGGLQVWDTANLTPTMGVPIYEGAVGFVAEAIAGDPSTWIVVGKCGSGSPRACVVVDGQGPFDVQGNLGTPWPVTAGVDFGGVTLTEAKDVSSNGRVLVGTGVDSATQSEVGFRLKW
jgi:hypothetical protein